MPIEYKNNMAVFSDVVSVDEAGGLHEWLQSKHSVRIDLDGCTHLHPEHLLVLMAAKNRILFWPTVLYALAAYSGKTLMGDGSILMMRNLKEAV